MTSPASGTTVSKHRRFSRSILASLALAGLVGATSLSSLQLFVDHSPAQAETLNQQAPAQGFADLVDKVMPAVISVEVKSTPVANNANGAQSLPQGLQNLPQDNQLRQFFEQFQNQMGQRNAKPRAEISEGSGFIVSADGYAVTNNHVVLDADKVTVTTSDGKKHDAKVIGTDPKTDLAVLKIDDGGKYNFVKLSQDKARVGDWVIAVGNPFGLGGTVTTGIISAEGRDIGSGPYDDYLQIDAPINRGNSGGPAFNLKGEVVGVNTAIYSPSGGSVGIGFAIPAKVVDSVVGDLKSKGSVTRGWLGVQIQNVTQDIADSIGLKQASGALISGLTDDSPAAKAGLKPGDTVVKLNGEAVASPHDLAAKVAQIAPGNDTNFTVFRGGKEVAINVKIGTMPGDTQHLALNNDSHSKLGLKLQASRDGKGVVIAAVSPDSMAAEKGLKAGDVILEIAGIEVNDPIAVKEALKKAGTNVLLLVRSGDRQMFVALTRKAKS